MRLWVLHIATVVALFGVLPCVGAAQSDVGGLVSGRVSGPDGRAVAGALVRIENAATGEHAEVRSDARGDFHFDALNAGGYTLRVQARGLSAWEADNLVVGVGATARLHAELAHLTRHHTVLVDARTVMTGSAQTGAGEESRVALTDLPSNGRQWTALAALFGASSTGAFGAPSFRGLSPLMNSIAIDGADHTLAFRGGERGVSSGGNGFAAVQSALSEFQVGSSGFSAGYGRAGGGAITAITRGGANHMRGQATFYDRGAIGQTFNAYTKVMQEEPAGTTVTGTGQPVLYVNGLPVTYVEVPYHAPDRRQEWDVEAGGPIRRGRAYWFFAWDEHLRSNPAVARANEPQVFFQPPSAASLSTLQGRLATSTSPLVKACPAVAASGSTATAECVYAKVLQELNGLLGAVPRQSHQTVLFPKLTVRVDDRNQLVVQYNAMRRTGLHSALSGASETEAVDSFGDSSTSDDEAVVRWDWLATPRLTNSARYQFSRDVLAQSPAKTSGFEQQFAANAWGLPPEVTIDRSEGFSFGTLAEVNKHEYPAETREQLLDAATWMRGRQALRFGFDYNYVTDAIEGLNGEDGSYTYASLLDFVSDFVAPDSCDGTTSGAGRYPCYSKFRQTVGAPNWKFETADYAGYVADEWRPASRLTLTLGARWDYEQLPNPHANLVNAVLPETARLPQNRTDAGPRGGFAWDVSGRGRIVLRGGYGLYYGRVPNATVFSALTSTGSARSPRTYSWRPLDAGAPAFPFVFASGDTPYTDPAAPDQQSSAPEAAHFDARFRHPQIEDAELSLEQALGARTSLIVTAMATNGHHLTQFTDTNIDTSATAEVFYTVQAPGNDGNAGPMSKFASPAAAFSNLVYAPERFYYRRNNPGYGAITDINSETDSSYRAAMVRVVRRLSRAMTVNAGYTWAHAIDDNQNEATFADRNDVYDPADPRVEHGTSNYDVRQRVAGGIVLRTPWRVRGVTGAFVTGYTLAGSGEWRTGLPYTMRTTGVLPAPSCSYEDWLNAGGATANGGNCLQAVHAPDASFTGASVPIASLGAGINGSGGEDLLPPMGRNSFRYPAAANLDVRLTKKIRISDRYACELMAEGFNALNHTNVSDLQTGGYRVSNDPAHANMATLTWQSGVRPGTKTVMTNGSTQTEYVFDPTAAFGGVTNANNGGISRERQIQAGIRLSF